MWMYAAVGVLTSVLLAVAVLALLRRARPGMVFLFVAFSVLIVATVFAALYYTGGCLEYKGSPNPSFGVCAYFSLCTITGLGYSVVTPADSLGLLLSGMETTVGWVFLGMLAATLVHILDRVRRQWPTGKCEKDGNNTDPASHKGGSTRGKQITPTRQGRGRGR